MSIQVRCDSCWKTETYSGEWRVVEIRQPVDEAEAVLLHDLALCPACAHDLSEKLGLYAKGVK